MKRWCLRCVLVVLILSGLVYLFANQLLATYVARYLPEFQNSISQALEADVLFEGFVAELHPLPQLHADKVSIRWHNPQRHPLIIDQFKARIRLIPLFAGQVDVSSIRFHIPRYKLPGASGEVNDIHLQARLLAEGDNISLRNADIHAALDNLPLHVRSTHVLYAGKRLELERLEISSDDSLLGLDGYYSFEDGSLKLQASNVHITQDTGRKISEIFLMRFPTLKLQVGSVQGNALIERDSERKLKAEGDLTLKNVKRGKELEAGSAILRGLAINLSATPGFQAVTDLQLENVRITDEKTVYSTDRLTGRINVSQAPEGGLSLGGNAALTKFRYADDRTTVHDVDAVVDPFNYERKNQGGAHLSLTLNGSALQLDHESIRISRASGIRGKIEGLFPLKGDYKVSGPISVAEADLTTTGQKLDKVRGTVQMTIMANQKSFASKELQFNGLGKPSRLSADFRMSTGELTLASAETDYLGGMLSISGHMSRGDRRMFKVQGRGQRLDIQRIHDAVVTDRGKKVQGMVQSALLSMSGDVENFSRSVSGGGDISVEQPDADKTVMSKLLLGALRSVPVVGDIIDSGQSLGDRQLLKAKVHFKDGGVHFDEASLTRQNYTVNARGRLGFDKQLQLKGEVIFLQDTLSKFALGFAPLRKLLTRVGRIVVPISVRGTIPDISVDADIKTFLKDNSGLTLGQNMLGQIGDLVLPSDKRATPVPAATP